MLNKFKGLLKITVLLVCFCLVLLASPVFALITDGDNAVDMLGQYDWSNVSDPQPKYTKNGFADSPNPFGYNFPNAITIDEANHRLFLADSDNNRVLIYNLDVNNELVDRVPDFVLGQNNFDENVSGFSQSLITYPSSLGYDSAGQRLFVGDDGCRILVFDVAAITNGEDAINVLGQTDFNSTICGVTDQSSFGSLSAGMTYDEAGQRLFVPDNSSHRVLVFDVGAITDGENAVNVLGQINFTANSSATGQNRFNNPQGLGYDSAGQRLFVTDISNHRVLVFDVAGITDGEAAINVLGQGSFGGNSSGLSQSTFNSPQELLYEAGTQRLFVADSGNHRVVVFDVVAITDGENAINVLGQINFTSNSSNTTQSKFSAPLSMAMGSAQQILYITDLFNHRLLVFDVAAITNGEDAVDLLGQYDGTSFSDPQPIYTKGDANDWPNRAGLSAPTAVTIDEVEHRLFISDYSDSRIFVYNLNNDNTFQDHVADFVIGQPDFVSVEDVTTQSGLYSVTGMAIDQTGERLFVADQDNCRILVFDSGNITNGQLAVNVLGQPDFTTNDCDTTQLNSVGPLGLAYDDAGQRLFVADYYANRVLVFDVASISDGEAAINVLGQPDFTSDDFETTQTGMGPPTEIAFDPINQRLFVADIGNYRVLVYDVAAITDGEPAVNVLGQINFTSDNFDTTQSGMGSPYGLAFDVAEQRLFVADYDNNRVLVFDATAITDGEPAINVLGQNDFISGGSATTQAGMMGPNGLAYDNAEQKIYVADNDNHRVLVFDASTGADVVAPVIAEVTPVPTPAADTTPDYTFSSTEAGSITYGGDCSSATTAATVGNNTITFNALAIGIHNNCTITVTDAATNVSNILNVISFEITAGPDLTAPVIAEVNPVPTPDSDTTPDYTFSSDEAGDITYGGSCSSIVTAAIVGNNTVTFDPLAVGVYNDCTIMVTDASLNDSNLLAVTSFEITNPPDVTSPVIAEVLPVTTPSTNTTPSYTFSSDEVGTITYGGSCSSPTALASIGNNTITFNALLAGTYSNCTITVTDGATNVSNLLNISSFTINNPPSGGGGGGGGGAGGGFGQPASSGGKPQTPSEPEEPTEEETPTAPSEPTQPTEPQQPEQPSNPQIPPTIPVTPVQPTVPQTAVIPETQPIRPAEPIIPTEPDLAGEEVVFITQPPETVEVNSSGSGVYGREANRTITQLSFSCNYAAFSAEYGITIDQNSDSDGDGLSDQLECLAQTNPTETDSDGDGLSDAYEELTLGTNPNQSNGAPGSDMLIITTPEQLMLTGDKTPLVKGINTAKGDVNIYIFDRADFDEIAEKIQEELNADENLNDQQRAEIYAQKFTEKVQEILAKFINDSLDAENPEEAKFIDRIQLLGETPTGNNSVFLLDSQKSLIDNTYLAMAYAEDLFSEEVEFEVDSSLKVLNPNVESLGSKPIPLEALLGELKIEIDPGNFRPVLAGNIKEPSKIVANWQSDVVSSALIADSLDEDFRLSAPSDLEPGEHNVYVTAYRRSDGAQSETLKIPFTVSADGAITFQEEVIAWWIYALAGLVLVALTGGIAMSRRKKTDSQEL